MLAQRWRRNAVTPEEREALKQDILDGVVDELQPRLDEWFGEFEDNFIRKYSEMFDGQFADKIKRCTVERQDRGQTYRVTYKP